LTRSTTSTVNPRWQRLPNDRPRALMASAFKLLLRRGYRRIRVEDVAEDAGVSKATVYHYFATKDELLTRCVANRIAAKHADIEQRLASAGGTASERLQIFLRRFWTVALTQQSGLWQRLLVSEIVTEAPDVFDVGARGLVQRWRLVEQLIKEGQRTGEFRLDADAQVAARMIVSALSHQALFHMHLGMRHLAPCDPDRLFTSAVTQLLNGLRPCPRQAIRR
jgi:AcrR family transcriptional regulator